MKLQALFATVALCLTSLASAAELKLAVVDMKRALNEYSKGQELASKIKVNAEKFSGERTTKIEEFKKMADGLKALQKKTQDPILSQSERAKAGAELQSKVKDLQSMETEIKEFEQRRAGQLREEESQVRTQILEEMTKVVEKIGKEGGYNAVMDKSGISIGTVPIFMYVDGVPDLTDALIAALNKGTPSEKK
ncbi:MAG: OmpH family outer membrane protein [Verrucomicrobiaceae bacterium]|nr:OmpH family outer membrane protein [Verrucomicrobiaceae bacterium]